MRLPGWRVDRSQAEVARRSLRDMGCLNDGWAVVRDGGAVIFPLTVAPEQEIPGSLVEHEFTAAQERGPRSYRDRLDWSAEQTAELPRSFDVVGDIVLIRIPDTLVDRSEEIGRALLEFVPGARLVARDEGVKGAQRRRRLVRLAGAGEFRTLHHENGLSLEVDVERAYFSPRLAREHRGVADLVVPGERVLDLCCGVGPFALTIAHDGSAGEIVAVDSNPEAVALLRANLARLRLGKRVRAVEQDLEAFLPSAGVADRVVFNLPHEGIKYLASVGSTVAPAGTLHYYEVTERESSAARPEVLLRILGGPEGWALTDRHVVHPYSPRSDLIAYALRRGPR